MCNTWVLDDSDIIEFSDNLDWYEVSKCQVLSENIICKFRNKILFDVLLKNKNQNINTKYYTIEFIKDFSPRFNEYYKYIYAANTIRSVWLKHIYKPGNVGHTNEITKFENMFME